MALFDSMKEKFQQLMQGREQDQQFSYTMLGNGGTSGFNPQLEAKARKKAEQRAQNVQPQELNAAGPDIAPGGVNVQPMQGGPVFPNQQNAQQPYVYQFSQNQAAQGNVPPQATGYQHPPFRGTGYQQMPPVQQPFQAQPTGYQQMPPQQPQQPFQGMQPTGYQQMQPQQNPGNVAYNPTDYVTPEGGYKVVLRVAHVTSVTGCLRLIEFMHNGEAVLINAETITNEVEADRCMDLMFGAACAFKQRLIRVSGKQIYLITPASVRVESYTNMLNEGLADIERRWPGALEMNLNPVSQSYQQMQGMPQQPMQNGYTGQVRVDDFAAAAGRRSAQRGMREQQNQYTSYGGFNSGRR